jgi:aspartyl-tRNA(Asn)/glutamyl-tRNA(Gln) amidotransferase subunit A
MMIRTAGISDLGLLLRSGRCSAVEIATSALAAVEEEEPKLNAFITITAERALAEAAAVDQAIARGDDLGPLMGIPWAIKDVFATEGAPTTGGSAALRDSRPEPDAEIVTRMRGAGAVLIGKTNLHELGWGLAREFGRTNNPHDLSLGSGGSSGGSAAAVACGAIPLAVGTDAGGSVRMPAAFCGIVGFKPTHGRVSMAGHVPAAWSVGDAGPLSRSVTDIAAAFATLSGRRVEMGAAAPLADMRIGRVEGATLGASGEIADAYAGMLAALASACTIDTIEVDLTGAFAAWAVTYAAELSDALRHWLGERLGATSPELQEIIAMGLAVPAPTYLRAQRLRTRLFDDLERALHTRDVLVTPAVLGPPPATEEYWTDEEASTANSWLSPLNLTGHPALVLPLGSAGSGASVQLIGRHGDDERLLATGLQIEMLLAESDAPRP